MKPTIQEQLHGIGRLVDHGSAELLESAAKQLKRLAGAVAHRPAFLQWDNEMMIALLDDLTSASAAELQSERFVDDEARNDALRERLTSLIHSLPYGEAGDQARRSIADHLCARVAANPALHKHPELPWEATEQSTKATT